MARPESQAIAGYYPTPHHLIPAIARLLTLEREDHSTPLLFDPCAGTGAALLELASSLLDLPAHRAARHCRGIELEATRGAALAAALPLGNAHTGDAFTFGLGAHPGASVLFLNPPYDVDPDRTHRRLEHRFLLRFTDALAPGGALLLVVPHTSLSPSAELLAARYTQISIWRFPDPDFAAYKQVIVVAELRADPIPSDRRALELIRAAAADPASLPVLGRGEPSSPLPVRACNGYLAIHPHAVDLTEILANAEPFMPSAALMGFDRDARDLLGQTLPVALPPRPAHIALALAAGLLNGRRLTPNPGSSLPSLLAKGTFSRALQTVDRRTNANGEVTGEICIQQPRLDLHVLRLDSLAFHRLALGTEPTGARDIEHFNTADLLTQYSTSLARLVRQQLPALHDPDNPAHQLELPPLARKPFRRQAALIQAGLKLLALGENPQVLAEVGTGKSTVALSIAGLFAPAHFAATTAELTRLGFNTTRLRPVRRSLVVCPPHLLDNWTDQIRHVLPLARVQVVDLPSHLDRDADIYVLSREAAKLGAAVAGVRGDRCPHCSHPLPLGDPDALATERRRCIASVLAPSNLHGHLLVDLVAKLLPALDADFRNQLLPYLERHPALYRRASALDAAAGEPLPVTPTGVAALHAAFERLAACVEDHFLSLNEWDAPFWRPFRAAAHLAAHLGVYEHFAARCRDLEQQRENSPRDRYLAPISAALERKLQDIDPTNNDNATTHLELALKALLNASTWSTLPGCGAPLYTTTPSPRRVPLARYILRKKPTQFDLLILDELHEFSTSGSAQQKAAHRLVQLPRVPVLALTGSLMGGYASSLFANAWALSRRFRAQFELDDKAAFVNRYGYKKLLVPAGAVRDLARPRRYGRHTDRTDEALGIRQLGEAPGVLPSFILEHILPTGLVMHKADLDDALPLCTEEPTPVAPAPDDFLDAKLLTEFKRLRTILLARIHADRRTDRAGLLWGAMSELPAYLDLASEDCGEFVLAYPEDAGGAEVARGASLPSAWRSPKERWLLEQLHDELAADRRVLLFLRHTGNRGFVRRLARLILEDLDEHAGVLDSNKVSTRRRERWIDGVVAARTRVLLTHPKAVQTGLNNLTAFHTAIWLEGPDFDPRLTRQANGRPHRIGQNQPVRLIYPYYAGTLQKTALDLVARKITASLQVDGLSLVSALEAAGALSDEDRRHADAALSIGQALYRATVNAHA